MPIAAIKGIVPRALWRSGKALLHILLFAAIVFQGWVKCYAERVPLPAGFVFDGHAGPGKYKRYVLPCINWLIKTPLGQQREDRQRINVFVLNWLQINPDINIGLPDYSYEFHNINEQLLYIFMEGWIRYALTSGDTDANKGRLAGIHTMLDYYQSGKAAELGKNEFLDHLMEIDRKGGMMALFDTGISARNTYLYLYAPPERDHFQYNDNYFNFNFNCINLMQPRKILYRYRLDGYFNKWIVTRDGSVTYPRLPPGNYTFRVEASVYPDFRKVEEATYDFFISKPFWDESWFIVLSALVALSVIYLVVRQREKNLRNIALLKQERMIFEYEHLKSQVNPHFLFNSLNTLTNLISRDTHNATRYAENLSSLYQNILAYHDHDLVLLAEEIGILDNYYTIQKGRFGKALELHMAISPELMKTKRIVPMALQMLIENVIKHNVISCDEPLVVEITANEAEIEVRNRFSPKLSSENRKGLGLMNIKRRYELLTRKPVTFGLIENEFIVKLPLL